VLFELFGHGLPGKLGGAALIRHIDP